MVKNEAIIINTNNKNVFDIKNNQDNMDHDYKHKP